MPSLEERAHAVAAETLGRYSRGGHDEQIILAALRVVRNEALEAAAYKIDLGQRWSRDGLGGTKFTNEAADAIRALIVPSGS